MTSESKNSKHNKKRYEDNESSYCVSNSRTINKIGDNVKIIHDKIRHSLNGIIYYIVSKSECLDCEFNILVNIDHDNYVWCKKDHILTIEEQKSNIQISNDDIDNYFEDSIDIDSFIDDYLITLKYN